MPNWCASTSAAWRLLKKLRKRQRSRKLPRRKSRRRSLSRRLPLLRPQLQARNLRLVPWLLVLRRRLAGGRVLRRTLPQLALRRLRVLHAQPHPLERQQLIRRLRLIRLAQRLRLRDPQQLHQRLLLRPPVHVLESRPLLPRRCGLPLHREARLRGHVLREQLLERRVLLARLLRLCNAIRCVREGLVVLPANLGPARRKACARLVVRRNNIVRAVRRRAVLAERPGSVPVDRRRGSRNAPEVAVGQAAATIKDQ